MLPAVTKISQRTENTAYPKSLNSLGDHIRKKRLDLELQQKDVARILKVAEATVYMWENNRVEPKIRYYPVIVDFLGYCPYEHNDYTPNFGQRVRQHRIYRGLSHRKLAKILGADPCSVRRWEKNEYPPWKRYRDKIERFMKT